MSECDHSDADRKHLFCHCGKLLDRAALKKVRFRGFIGIESLSPQMERFYSTGDPDSFSQHPQ